MSLSRPPIEVFCSYALADKALYLQLETHLSVPLPQGQRIALWHRSQITGGNNWKQVRDAHLNQATLILLLISSDFFAFDSGCGGEMQRALERGAAGTAHVIPILLRPVNYQGTPFAYLSVLPTNGRPITSWPNQDDAFVDVVQGIQQVIADLYSANVPAPLSPPSSQPQEKGKKNLQRTNVIGKAFLPEILVAGHETRQESTTLTSPEEVSQVLIPHPSTSVDDDISSLGERISPPQSKHSRKRGLLVSTAIFLVLVVSLVPFLSLPTCFFAFCHSSPQPTKQPSLQQQGEAHDQNLSVELVAVVSPSFVFSDTSQHPSGDTSPPTSISAVLLPKNTSTYDTIIINVQSLRNEGVDILIDYVALKLLSIPALPRPLRVWTPGASTTYIGYPYPVTYKGQQPGQLLYAEPSKHVILAPARPNHAGEPDPISLQVMSTVTAYLRFQVEITYQITDASQTLILPQTFQVVFSDSSNWQEETL